jgi:aminopeptidase N
VAIEIYYHQGHEYNLDRMVASVKASLDYFTTHFSPYQHRQVRIIEFPRYASFAQAFPNTIPYSESIGFIARVREDEDKDVDYPYYVTAHEVAHQWWAHQVIGAKVQGSTLMSESLAQYSALMVMEQKYGKDKMKRFLQYELDSYLRGRSGEREKEQPLYRVENQGYIHYQKGSLILYALKDYLGEEKLNQALADYIKEVAYQEAPYTTSLAFLRHIRQATPDSLQYLVNDMFEKITLYENRAVAATYKDLGNDQYRVTLELDSKKFYADSLGNEQEQPFRDLIEVGVFAEAKENGKSVQKPLYLQKHWLPAGQNKLELTVKGKPVKAGIDPYNKLIDRNPTDNVVPVTGGG